MQQTREAARRSPCKNNLKQLWLASHNFHDTFNHLATSNRPPGTGTKRLSGLTRLLPYLDLAPAFNLYGQTKQWSDLANRPVVSSQIASLLCPSAASAIKLDGDPDPVSTRAGYASNMVGVTDYSPNKGVAQSVVPFATVAGSDLVPQLFRSPATSPLRVKVTDMDNPLVTLRLTNSTHRRTHSHYDHESSSRRRFGRLIPRWTRHD